MKKFFGVLLIVAGSFLSLATLISNLPLLFKSFFSLLHDPSAYTFGGFIGAIVIFLLLMALALFLIVKGAKWAKSTKTKQTEPLEEY